MSKPRDYSHNHNVRDSKGRFTKAKKNYDQQEELEMQEKNLQKHLQAPFVAVEIIVANCTRCGKLFSVMKDKLVEKGGLCTVCFLTPEIVT